MHSYTGPWPDRDAALRDLNSSFAFKPGISDQPGVFSFVRKGTRKFEGKGKVICYRCHNYKTHKCPVRVDTETALDRDGGGERQVFLPSRTRLDHSVSCIESMPKALGCDGANNRSTLRNVPEEIERVRTVFLRHAFIT